jgi:hypothetical protein
VILVRSDVDLQVNRALEELYAQKLGENLKVAIQYHLLAQVKQCNSACCHVSVARHEAHVDRMSTPVPDMQCLAVQSSPNGLCCPTPTVAARLFKYESLAFRNHTLVDSTIKVN